MRNIKGGVTIGKADNDNHSTQLNPNNDVYWQSRGWDERPEDWEEAIKQDKDQDKKEK